MRIGTQTCELLEFREDEALLRNVNTLEVRCAPLRELLEKLNANEISVLDCPAQAIELAPDTRLSGINLQSYSDAQIKRLGYWMSWIQSIRHKGYDSFDHANDLDGIGIDLFAISRAHPEFGKMPRPRLLIQHARTFIANGSNPLAIVPQFHARGGKGKSRLSSQCDELIETILENARQTKSQKLIATELYEAYKNLHSDSHAWAESKSTNTASFSTFNRRFRRAFNSYEVAERNIGQQRARRLYRSHFPRIRADAPLMVVEFDDVDTGIFAIDKRTGLPWGRPWATFGIDQYSSAHLGHELSERHRCSDSALAAYLQTRFPKEKSYPDYAACSRDHLCYGRPMEALFDNALYNHSKQIETALLCSGTSVAWAKPYSPTEKSVVEDFNKTIKQRFLSRLPGWHGGKPKHGRDGLNEGLKQATMSIQELRVALNKWIVDEYMNTPRAQGLTPRELWNQHFRLYRPISPPDRAIVAFQTATQSEKLKQLNHNGLMLAGLPYQSLELITLRKRLGPKVKVHYRRLRFNLDFVYVQDPERLGWLVVPCEHRSYVQGLTAYQQQLILKRCRSQKAYHPDLRQLCEARDWLVQLVEQESKSIRLSERARSQRQALPKFGTWQNTSQDQMMLVTSLEGAILDLDEIEMDSAEEGWTWEALQ